jgi:hypothetical protein
MEVDQETLFDIILVRISRALPHMKHVSKFFYFLGC